MAITVIAKIILVMFLWAVCFPLITIGIESASHLTFAALRAVLAGLTLTILAFSLRRPLPRTPRIWWTISIIGFGATSLGFFGMFHAAEFVTPGLATVIANTQPLLAAILAVFLLRERLTARGIFGLCLGFLGILVISSPYLLVDSSSNYPLGVAYIILAACGITISNVLIKRVADDVDPLMAMGLQMLIGSIPLMFAAWALEAPIFIQWSLSFVGSLFALSIFGTALVYYLWISILKTVPLNIANAFSFLIPIFGLTLGAFFYGEILKWPQIIGILLAVLGVAIVTHRSAVRVAEDRG